MSSIKSVRPNDRASTLKVQQTLKMAGSAHAYVRGSTIKFYEWLEEQDRGTIPDGPPVWICGDCHAGNLGPVASSAGKVAVQIRDLDQTVIGNPAHDLMRLALSLATAARGCDLPGVVTARILEQMIDGYRSALLGQDDYKAELPASVKFAMKRSVARSWKHLARERLKNAKPTIPLGAKFWGLNKIERRDIDTMFASAELQKLATTLRGRSDGDKVEVIDAAYWMKGCSSLGKLRYAVLLKIGKGKKSDLALMDVKEAVVASAPRDLKAKMPKDNAERVLAGAKALSPNLGDRMVATKLSGRSVFIRELLPQDLKLDLDELDAEDAMRAASYLAGVVGLAHGRQMSVDDRTAWAKEMGRNTSKSLGAPSWLWQSVVTLIGTHEVAYLEHCRRYAGEQTGDKRPKSSA